MPIQATYSNLHRRTVMSNFVMLLTVLGQQLHPQKMLSGKELIRLRTEKNERDGQLQLLQHQMAEMQKMLMDGPRKEAGEPEKKKKIKMKKNVQNKHFRAYIATVIYYIFAFYIFVPYGQFLLKLPRTPSISTIS